MEKRDGWAYGPSDGMMGSGVRAPGAVRGAGARSPLFWKALLVAMALMWGFSFVVMKGSLGSISTFLLLACRFGASAVIMLAVFRGRIAARLDRRHLAVGLGMGVLMWAAFGMQTMGLVETTAGKNSFLTGTYCILVPFISYLIARVPITRFNLMAAVLCIAGIGLVALDDLAISRGDLLTLGGAFFFACQIAAAAKYGRELDVNVTTFWMYVAVSVLSAVVSAAFEPSPASVPWSPELVGAIAFLAVFCTCIGLLVQNLALAHVPPSTGSLLLSLESPSGVFFATVLSGEALTPRLLAGFGLIFLSIVVSETRLSFLAGPARRRP